MYLLFLSRHQMTLLGAEPLGRLLGYETESLLQALDALEALELVARSRLSQGARIYQCVIPLISPRREPWLQLQALASHRAGRLCIVRQLRQTTYPYGQKFRRTRKQAISREERHPQWLKIM